MEKRLRTTALKSCNHGYNRDYICLQTSSEGKQTPFVWFDVSIFSDNIRYE